MPAIQLAGGVLVKDEPIMKKEEEPSEKKTSDTVDDGHESVAESLKIASDDATRGSNKSGRTWKTVRKTKASMAVLKPLKKTLGSTWEKRQAEKLKLQEAKELQEEMLAKKKEKFEAEKVKNAEKRKRKAENELKSAKVQVMSRPEKLKKMSKKQLKSVYKTRMGEDGVVRLVGAYQ